MWSMEAFEIAAKTAQALSRSCGSLEDVLGRLTATRRDDVVQAEPHRDVPSTSTKESAWKDHLAGGLADNKTPSDFPRGSLRKGMAVEREHVARKDLQKEIAMDHLTEDPRYYDRLEAIEKKAFETSMYSGPLSYGPFPQASQLPPFRAPELAVKPVKPSGKLKTASRENRPTAVIITGNPKFIHNNPDAHRFYNEIKDHLEQSGHEVSFDAGEPHTSPKRADLWVAHSRGSSRLRYAPEGTRTVLFGSAGGLTHPQDNAVTHGPSELVPNKYHYTLTDEMRSALVPAAKTAATSLTPAGRLANSAVLGKPKAQLTPAAGPSIHSVSSVHGVKTPKLPGAGKGNETI